MLKITILTICPEMFGDFLASHCIALAEKRQLAKVEIVDIRDYAGGSFRKVDDSPYGGGPGMVLRAEPVYEAIMAHKDAGSRVIFLSPAGQVYHQKKARALARAEHLILLCGHYEGIDARILPFVDEELSVGDYILSGGEIAAMAVTDSVLRLLKGNLKEGSAEEESFEDGLLEYPQYTRPVECLGQKVPEVLLSGNHEAIAEYRKAESLRMTREKRPDLLNKSHFVF